jgi:protein N-terminal glutamine amidohydrolase
VALITNEAKACAVWNQRAAPRPELPVLWDYHVVAFARGDRWMAWDADSLLEMPVPADEYLRQTFLPVPAELMPRFRVLDGADYAAAFSSDRAHMRNPDGSYREPPPPWPPIVKPGRPSFTAWLDLEAPGPGEVMDLPALAARLRG